MHVYIHDVCMYDDSKNNNSFESLIRQWKTTSYVVRRKLIHSHTHILVYLQIQKYVRMHARKHSNVYVRSIALYSILLIQIVQIPSKKRTYSSIHLTIHPWAQQARADTTKTTENAFGGK